MRSVLPSVCLFAIPFGLYAQGSFQNLDFESARIVPLPSDQAAFYPYSIATTNALPGWSVSFGNSLQTQINYNDPALGSTFISIYATNGNNLDGNVSVLLQGGSTASGASITQTGVVPAGSQSILFKAQATTYATPVLDLNLGGQNISYFALQTTSKYTLYGANISLFSGQSETLTFLVPQLPTDNDWNIDDITFSSSPIPEPTTCVFILSGVVLFSIRSLRKR